MFRHLGLIPDELGPHGIIAWRDVQDNVMPVEVGNRSKRSANNSNIAER